jgi:Cu-Zn family superoxide dismutase
MRAPLLVAAAVATSITGIGTASAARAPHATPSADPTHTYALPGDAVFPESVGVSKADHTYYVGSTGDGTVFKGSTDGTEAAVFLPGGADGRTFVAGVKVDGPYLLLAGGATGQLFVYDRRTGAFIKKFVVPPTGAPTFINDVAIARNGDLYVSDSLRPTIWKIPAADVGTPSADPVELVPWIDLSAIYVSGFNFNGIVVTSHDRYVLATQSATGQLWRITIADKTIRQIDLGGVTLPNADGLALSGHTAYVAQNALSQIVRIDLKALYGTGTVVSTTTDPTFMYTTAVALLPGRLLVVNSQFNNRGGTPVLPFTVSNVARP